MLTVRPKVAELQFSLFGRALHPELFQVCRSQHFQRGGYEARIDITNAGHVVTWNYDGITLTEVAATSHHPLPEGRRLLRRRLHGHKTYSLECRKGVKYEVCFQLEPANPELFWMFQQEIAKDGRCKGMLHMFEPSGRLALGALSYVYAETRNRSLSIQSFHTFPDDCAIVKVQSQVLLPPE